MEIEFVGAAREVTGSCHIVHANGRTVLLDCGLFQGNRHDSDTKNRELPIPVSEIDAVVLSHAHIDHSGRLPFLVRNGYTKAIFATPATRDLCAVMLADSAHIQESEVEHLAKRHATTVEPLYSLQDTVRTQSLMVGVPYGKTFDVVPGVRCTYLDAGHILGSASVMLDVTEGGAVKRLVFSGDIGRTGLAVVRDPVPPDGADVVIMESTYGNRDHESISDARTRLAEIVRNTAARGGRVMIPAFAVGRTQEVLYNLHGLVRDGEIPAIPIYVDSPLAIDITTVFELHPEVLDHSESMVNEIKDIFRFNLVHFTRTVDESKALNVAHGPMVIVAASGMVEKGRILHHIQHGAADSRNTILIIGFQAKGTLGRRIVERQSVLHIYGEDVPLRAQVEVINGYSAHADRTELLSWLEAVHAKSPKLQSVFLVHGEPEQQDAFSTSMTARGYKVHCPNPRERLIV